MDEDEIFLKNVEEKSNPIDLTWKNVSCSIMTKTGQKRVLKSVSGHAIHGELLVIMGSSGAGKTTLLNILSDRLQTNELVQIEGEIEANSQALSSFGYSNYIGYVTQEDALVETLTVFESLLFVANLKTSHPNKQELVSDMINDLSLKDCKNTLVGGPYIQGISGGEKKRLSIGIELISNPSVLFLDEPTSGLDSYTAMSVCKLLTEQAEYGKTVITTVHQPNSEMFYHFDKLMLLCNGQVMYHGTAKDSVKYFADIGFVCPSLSNPADYYMDLLYLKNTNELTDSEQQVIDKLTETYKQKITHVQVSNFSLENLPREYNTGFFTQLYYLTYRMYLLMIRNPFFNFFRLGILLFVAVLVNVFFWDVGTTGQKEINNRIGCLFLVMSCLIFLNALSSVFGFISMRAVIIKEYNSHLYGVVPYFFSVVIVDLVVDLFSASLFSSLIYWTVDLNTNSGSIVITFFFLNYLTLLIGGSIGFFCGILFTNAEVSLSLGSIIIFPTLFYSGFFRNSTLPDTVGWIKYLSSVYYIFQGLMKNEFDDLELHDCCKFTSYDCGICKPLDFYDIELEIYQSLIYTLVYLLVLRIMSLLAIYDATRKKK